MIEINCSEQDIEDFLCKDNNLYKYLNLRFLKRQVVTPVGVIDIVAYNNNTKRFVIIELKKDILDSKAFFQLDRYRNCIQKIEYLRWEKRGASCKNFKDERIFDCLLIGKNISPDLYYSVEHWDPDSDLLYARMWYTLFGYNFDTAMNFGYLQPAQIDIEQETYERMYK